MQLLELTLADAAGNLALDAELLDRAEAAGAPTETLRLWEPPSPMVVIGRSSDIEREVHLAECQERGIPVLRRPSGGAAIVTGPGCLMYALVLSYRERPHLRAIDRAHRFVLGRICSALAPLAESLGAGTIAQAGTSDLVLDGKKFSGNSMRCRREHVLYHGTLLYAFDLDLIESCLHMPPRQPDYRAGRPHRAFVANLPIPVADLRRALIEAWAGERHGA